MIAPSHILGSFDGALESLHTEVLTMASLAEASLDKALTGLLLRNDELCVATIADDEQIDQLEKQVDNDGVELLFRFQPLASDFRRVVSAMKLSSNLERVADMAVNIARHARKLNQHPPLPELKLIEPMRDQAMGMFIDSVKSFVREDDQLARSLAERDRLLDLMNAETGNVLIERMTANPAELRGYLNLLFVARHLERVGDHATNIAEDAVYVVAGEDIRHERNGRIVQV
jgi:phosphate transport system protein